MTDTTQTYTLEGLLAGQDKSAPTLSQIDTALAELNFRLTQLQSALRAKPVPRNKQKEKNDLTGKLEGLQSEMTQIEELLKSGNVHALLLKPTEDRLATCRSEIEKLQAGIDALRSVTAEERAQLEDLTGKIAFLQNAREAEAAQENATKKQLEEIAKVGALAALNEWSPTLDFPADLPDEWQEFFEQLSRRSERNLSSDLAARLDALAELFDSRLELMMERSQGLRPERVVSLGALYLSLGLGAVVTAATVAVGNNEKLSGVIIFALGLMVFFSLTSGTYNLLKNFWPETEHRELPSQRPRDEEPLDIALPEEPLPPTPARNAGSVRPFTRPLSVPPADDAGAPDSRL